MQWSGLALLIMVGCGILLTGLPAFLVLITAAALGALLGLATDTFPLALLGALPGRLINLFDSDLLQALPLYVTMGLLLNRLPVADALYRASGAILPRRPAAPMVSGMLLGALLGPMNGSVGASVLGLSRVVAPKLAAEGVPPAKREALIAVAATLGVLVPPSLVLILLSDAMLQAHTFAITETGRNDFVINTQDLFHAALVPAGMFMVLCVTLAWFSGRDVTGLPDRPRLTRGEGWLAAISLAALLVLLGGVAAGYFYAVEAAAVGAFALLAAGIVTGRLRGAVMRELLRDAMAITGALFALLLAATTFTLVLRLLGTDKLVNNLVAGIPGGDVLPTAIVLAVIGLCAFVLDAFEIIFVVLPIVLPPLLIRVADARWVAVLVLLTLQVSFLLPPFGYALMMVRGALKPAAPFRAFLKALAPFLLAQWLLLIVILAFPRLVHFLDNAKGTTRSTVDSISNEELNKRLNEMIVLPPPPELK